MRGRFVVLLVAASLLGCRSHRRDDPSAAASSSASVVASSQPPSSSTDPAGDEGTTPPRRVRRTPPTGAPPRLSCVAARALIDDVLARLAAPPPPIAAKDDRAFTRMLSDATIDWADPHGLWTASPDSPVATMIRAHGGRLREVMEAKADCTAELRPIGEAMVKWIAELRAIYDEGATSAKGVKLDAKAFAEAIGEGVFEDGPVTRPARELARELGRRAGVTVARQPSIEAEAAIARDRWLPLLDADGWSQVILAAAVRAFVPLLDPHSMWAPTEEASMLYDRDLELAPPPRLWGTSQRTTLGVRIESDAMSPLREGDVVLDVDGITLAGLSAEAIDQLSEAADGAEAEPRAVRFVRRERVLTVDVRPSLAEGDDDEGTVIELLPTQEIPYGDGVAIVVTIDDVPDALGDDLARALANAKARASTKEIEGLLIDLRGNGGGSIDGATGALGVFLAGVPLFPLKHRDGAIETERASEPPLEDRWTAPVAALVDGGTASAAEMIAGALHAYRRGVVVGTTTYGKGCAQEYVDDTTGIGVLRLTTLLYALPDGTPVQRIGLHPDIALPSPVSPSVKEHEVDLLRAPPTWAGPDVRDSKRVGDVPWPTTTSVGPCKRKDESLCKALHLLGGGKPTAKK